jgi:hypothetical protein
MTEGTSPALSAALAYYHAWTSHDLDKAMSYIEGRGLKDGQPGRRRCHYDAHRTASLSQRRARPGAADRRLRPGGRGRRCGCGLA